MAFADIRAAGNQTRRARSTNHDALIRKSRAGSLSTGMALENAPPPSQTRRWGWQSSGRPVLVAVMMLWTQAGEATFHGVGRVAHGLASCVQPLYQTTFLMSCSFQRDAWPSAKHMLMAPGIVTPGVAVALVFNGWRARQMR